MTKTNQPKIYRKKNLPTTIKNRKESSKHENKWKQTWPNHFQILKKQKKTYKRKTQQKNKTKEINNKEHIKKYTYI